MNKRPLLALVVVVSCLAPAAAPRGEGLSADERAFFDKHISSIVQVEPARVRSEAVDRAFRGSFFNVKLTIKQSENSREEMSVTVVRNGDEMGQVYRPSTTEDLPQLKGMLNPQLKLRNQKDAEALQDALDIVYPIRKGLDDKDLKAKAIKHAGHEWTFVRGQFFEKHAGFIFTTDASGAITGVRYSLELP